jgi:hypothetical protein
MSAAYGATLCDRRGRVLAAGRTVNISESGVYAMLGHVQGRLPQFGQIRLSIPDYSASASRRGGNQRAGNNRTVVYLCRIVRCESIGQLTAVGIEFIRKIS